MSSMINPRRSSGKLRESGTGSPPGPPRYNGRMKVKVVEYREEWVAQFEVLKAALAPSLFGLALAIEHVGSTSVPGLAAKPVIDIDIVVRDKKAMIPLISRLAGLGYVHQGDLGIAGREAFEGGYPGVSHHLYACLKGGLALRNHLALRDALRQDSALRDDYGRLKLRLASTSAGVD